MDFAVVMLIYLFGVIIGSIITYLAYCLRRASGILRIDHSDPDKDFYRFEIDDLDNLSKYKSIILKIRHETDLSQK